MNPFTVLNTAYKNLSLQLKRMFWAVILVAVAALSSSVGITATILGWRDGRIPNALGLEAAVKDLTEQTTKLAATDTVKMEAIAQRVGDATRQGIMADLDARETDARQNVLAPLLEQMKKQGGDINLLFDLLRKQGAEVRAIPNQMSRQLEDILQASKPPKSEAEIWQERYERQQARTDSILESLTEPKRKRMTKAPTM